MFLASEVKGFVVLCSYFFELQSLHVLIWSCSYKKRVYILTVANLGNIQVFRHVFPVFHNIPCKKNPDGMYDYD